MKKIILSLIVLSIICMALSGCIHWETPANYKLMQDASNVQSIRIYKEKVSEVAYNYSDPDDPCGMLLGEVPSEEFSLFKEKLEALSFHESHLIILFPVTYDPNFYYGEYIVKVVYRDGSCELISDCNQRQFRLNEKYPDDIRYGCDRDQWKAFVKQWIKPVDLNN